MRATVSESPRLARFVRATRRAGAAAVDRAWAELIASGSPLVEATGTGRTDRIVTFVWRPGGRPTVATVYTPMADLTPAGTALAPIGTTGVWYRTFRWSSSVRASYGFAPLALPALSDPGSSWSAFVRSIRADPLNPLRVRSGPNLYLSEVALPDSPPQPWVADTGAVQGSEERLMFRSRRLGNRRSVWVTLPEGFGARRAVPNLVIVFDGAAYQDPIPARRIVANLSAAGRIGATAVVLVDNAPNRRERELADNPAFSRFLALELLPWLRRRFGLRPVARRTVLAGSSLGGLAAASAALTFPRLFGAVLAQSGAFLASTGRPDGSSASIFERFAAAPRAPVRFYLDAGTRETIVPPGGTASLLGGARHLRDVLRAKGYPVVYREFEGGHDYACWRGTFADGLVHLLGARRRNRRRSGP